jgi:hypothetical protein
MTKRRASSTVLIIGATMPEAPASRSFEAVWNSPTGMRASAGLPAAAMSGIARTAAARS